MDIIIDKLYSFFVINKHYIENELKYTLDSLREFPREFPRDTKREST